MCRTAELTEESRENWDNFVRQHPAGHPFQLSQWREIMQESYGYRTKYLLAADEGAVRGVLPLFFVPSWLLGKAATTMPGGLCATSQTAAAILAQESKMVAQNWGAGRVRLQDSRQIWAVEGFHTETAHEHWLLDLTSGQKALWNGLDGNLRRQVRKARRNKLVAEVDRSGKLLEPFYRVFSHFTHSAGTPVFALEFLQQVIAAFPDAFNIVVIWHAGVPVAGYFQLELGERVHGIWGAALHDYLGLRPVHLGIWTIIEAAAERGFTCLDMGRSPAGSNASSFKGQWGGRAEPVHQQVLRLGRETGSGSLSTAVQKDGRFQLFMRVWPKLPYPVTQFVGPRLRRHIPFA